MSNELTLRFVIKGTLASRHRKGGLSSRIKEKAISSDPKVNLESLNPTLFPGVGNWSNNCRALSRCVHLGIEFFIILLMVDPNLYRNRHRSSRWGISSFTYQRRIQMIGYGMPRVCSMFSTPTTGHVLTVGQDNPSTQCTVRDVANDSIDINDDNAGPYDHAGTHRQVSWFS